MVSVDNLEPKGSLACLETWENKVRGLLHVRGKGGELAIVQFKDWNGLYWLFVRGCICISLCLTRTVGCIGMMLQYANQVPTD